MKIVKREFNPNTVTLQTLKYFEKVMEESLLYTENHSSSIINKLKLGVYQAGLFISKQVIESNINYII